jgi:diguanylate cyclase (GGDEF)-like protein/PAS domain S-box-containing protein
MLIGYLLAYSATPMPRFESHSFHEVAIAVATAIGLFVSYVSWRSHQATGEMFVRWLTAAFLMFTLIYAPHGLLTRTSHENIWLFLLFGPASRLAMLCCLAYGLAQYGKPEEAPLPFVLWGFWGRILMVSGLIITGVTALALSPVAGSPWVRMSMELATLLLCLLAIGVIAWRRIDSPQMFYFAMALAIFGQADIAFILAKPWDHLWWLAHLIFAWGFFILSLGVARALLTTRSFAAIYSKEELMHVKEHERAMELEQAQLEAANLDLHACQIRLMAVLNGVQDCVITIGRDGIVQSFNQAAERTFGYSSGEVIGKNVKMLMPEPYHSEHDGYIDHYVRTAEPKMNGRVREVVGKRFDGSLFPMELWINESTINQQTLFTASIRDITTRKAMEEEIYSHAFHDPLTKLPNRRLLDDRLMQCMADGKRSGRHGALLFLDLDKFKPLNDAYGHEVGDLLLLAVAGRLKEELRDLDTVARFGGDEFVVILGSLAVDRSESMAQAAAVAENIRVSISATYHLRPQANEQVSAVIDHQCSVSIGVYLFLGMQDSREKIIKCADTAMYEAKAAGRNLIRFHGSQHRCG